MVLIRPNIHNTVCNTSIPGQVRGKRNHGVITQVDRKARSGKSKITIVVICALIHIRRIRIIAPAIASIIRIAYKSGGYAYQVSTSTKIAEKIRTLVQSDYCIIQR